jgi:membrane fusion protein (multidrug efflux system)
VGGWLGSDWVVRRGLAEGDQVIVDTLMKLRPGAPVTERPAQPPGGASAAAGAKPAAASAAR